MPNCEGHAAQTEKMHQYLKEGKDHDRREDPVEDSRTLEVAEQLRDARRPRRVAEQQRHTGCGQSQKGHHHDDVENARLPIEAQNMRGPEGCGDGPGSWNGNRHGGRLSDRRSHGRFSRSFIERRNHSRLCRPKNPKQPGIRIQ